MRLFYTVKINNTTNFLSIKMTRLSLIVVFCFGLSVAHGQTTSFDSTKYFVKGIHFVLKDSTGKKITVYKDIKYETKIITEWNYAKKKWETSKPYTEAKGVEFYPREEVSMIDSIYFDEKYSVDSLVLDVVFHGGEMSWNNHGYINSYMKKELQRFSKPKEGYVLYLTLIVENKQGLKQQLFFRIY